MTSRRRTIRIRLATLAAFGPNLGGAGDRTTLLYLPSTKVAAGSFTCPAEAASG